MQFRKALCLAWQLFRLRLVSVSRIVWTYTKKTEICCVEETETTT
jgi:hypothetical protein